MGKKKRLKLEEEPLKLDLGCGTRTRDGFQGVDVLNFGQRWKADLRERWPWEDGSVVEAHASHFVEHLHAEERIHFVNELYRVLAPGASCQLITPHWANCRAYGDLTHRWPPVSEFWFYYLSKEWREKEAPHNTLYSCTFNCTWGYTVRGDLAARNQEYQQFALSNHKEAAQDLVATLTKA